MKIAVNQLRQIIREEVELAEINEEIRKARKTHVNEATRRSGMMLEGHNRITPEEMDAWMSGDWGFVSEASAAGAAGLEAEVAAFRRSMNRFIYPSGSETFRPAQAEAAVALVDKLMARVVELESQLGNV